jgi:hypothetical protein
MALAVPIHLKVKTQERLLVPRGCALGYESSFVGETLKAEPPALCTTHCWQFLHPKPHRFVRAKFAYI